MYRRILVPIDGSPTSLRGLQEAIRLAKDQKARLRLIHVVDEAPVIAGLEGAVLADDVFRSMQSAGRKILAEAKTRAARQGLQPEVIMVENLAGRIADLVIREAARWPADLIVLGTHGRRGVSHLVMGSDAEQIVRLTPVPVLLVRAPTPKRRR